MDNYVKSRHRIAKYYDTELKNLSLITPWQLPETYSAYHLYPILLKSNLDKNIQKKVYNELRKNKIAANLHYIPVHRHPYYEDLGFKKNDFPNSEKFHQEAISIPIYPTLNDKHQKYVVKILRKLII